VCCGGMTHCRWQDLLTPLVSKRGKAKTPAINARPQFPEQHLVLPWFCSFFGFVICLHAEMSAADFAVLVGSHVCCLPLLSRSVRPQTIVWLAGPIYGAIIGLQVVDLCFDFLILRSRSGTDNEALEAGKLAFQYYHLVLNAVHVNAILMCIILVAGLGSHVGFSRSSPDLRRTWLMLGLCATIGTGGYLVCVVSRYIKIRSAEDFSMELFDGWEMVLAARISLFICLVVSWPFLSAIATHADAACKEF